MDYDPPASKLVSMKQAAEHADLTRSALLKAAQNRTLWTVQLSRERFTTIEKVDEYLKEHGNMKHSRWLRPR